MCPLEVSKISDTNGIALKPEEVCLRAVSLLKMIINTSWNVPGETILPDKENVSLN